MKVNLKLIEEICNKYSNSGCSSLYIKGSIPEKQLNNAIKHFPIVGAKTIYLLYDSTLFNSGKTGFAICDNGVFYKNNGDTRPTYRHYTWEEFAETSISSYDGCVYFDEKYNLTSIQYRVHLAYPGIEDKFEKLLETISQAAFYGIEEDDSEEQYVSDEDDNEKDINEDLDEADINSEDKEEEEITEKQLNNSDSGDSKLCKSCGAAIPIGAATCSYCGVQIGRAVPIAPIVQKQRDISVSTDNSFTNNSLSNTSGTNINRDVQAGKPKNKIVALLLCFFLGYLGGHKFYEGKIGLGILYLFTLGLFFIGVIIDFIILLTKPETYYV